MRLLAPLAALLLWLGALPALAENELLLATTTSVRDSGLFDTLLPVFEQRTGITVRLVAVGTGAALRMGREGNADVLVTHAPAAEQALVASGEALDRRPFMENHFVIAGPAEDPAGVADAPSPEEALRRIRAAGAAYVSRGDDSGTHKREVALLRAAGLPETGGWPGFARTGGGMGLTLMVAGERRAYVLSDIGTFLAFQSRIDLMALSRPADSLRNVYSVLRIDPAKFRRPVRGAEATLFADFLLEPDTQRRIAAFGVERFGRALFRPLALAAGSPAPDALRPADASPAAMGLDLELILEITLRTLGVCFSALGVALLIGLPLGIALGRGRFSGRDALVSLVNAGMGAPPVVVGLLGALLLWRNGPLGSLELIYTNTAMVLVQIVIALPFVVGITLASVAALDPDWELQVRTLGVPAPWRVWLLLREIRLGLLAAVIAALGAVLSEVGAVLMVGGNLDGETRVLTTSIQQYTMMGEFGIAVGLAIVLLGLTLLVAALLTAVQQGGRG